MRQHLTAKQFKAFREEIRAAQKMPQITPAYLEGLARKRDEYLALLSF